MSAPVVPALGTTTNARKYIVEVDLNNNALSPNYQPVGGVKNFTFVSDDAQLQDDRRHSDSGYNRQAKTGTGWNATMTVSRAPQTADTTQYDAGQEYLRSKGEGVVGPGAQVRIRFYEFDPDATLPRVQVYAGDALVQYNEPNGGPLDVSDATFTFTGQGKLLKPTHPFPATPAVPNIDSVTPRNVGTAGGSQIVISGQHFTGTTAVTVGGTNVTAFTVLSDSTIVATVPAKTAGNQALVVTNGVGASTTGGNLVYA